MSLCIASARMFAARACRRRTRRFLLLRTRPRALQLQRTLAADRPPTGRRSSRGCSLAAGGPSDAATGAACAGRARARAGWPPSRPSRAGELGRRLVAADVTDPGKLYAGAPRHAEAAGRAAKRFMGTAAALEPREADAGTRSPTAPTAGSASSRFSLPREPFSPEPSPGSRRADRGTTQVAAGVPSSGTGPPPGSRPSASTTAGSPTPSSRPGREIAPNSSSSRLRVLRSRSTDSPQQQARPGKIGAIAQVLSSALCCQVI